MRWFNLISFAAWFWTFLALVVVFLFWSERMKKRSPLAFREVRVLGFPTVALIAMELARNDRDLQEALRSDKGPARMAEEMRRMLRDDSFFVILYTLLSVSGAALVGLRTGSGGVSGTFVVAACVAGVADFGENLAMWRGILSRDGGNAAGATVIRRWSLVKWHLLAAIGISLGAILFLGRDAGERALMSAIAGCLLIPFGAYCTYLMWMWWRSEGARW